MKTLLFVLIAPLFALTAWSQEIRPGSVVVYDVRTGIGLRQVQTSTVTRIAGDEYAVELVTTQNGHEVGRETNTGSLAELKELRARAAQCESSGGKSGQIQTGMGKLAACEFMQGSDPGNAMMIYVNPKFPFAMLKMVLRIGGSLKSEMVLRSYRL